MSARADLEARLSAEHLVPGDLGALTQTSLDLSRTADRLVDLAQGLAYIELSGRDWSGRAADVYAAAKDSDVATVKAAASIFDDAQQAIDGYTAILKSARHAAALARSSYEAGRKRRDDDLASCTPPPPPVSLTAPYDPYGLQAAADQLDAARREVRAAARVAAPFLRQLASAAPGQICRPTADGPSLRDIATAPWHVAHGIAVGWENTLKGWAAETAQVPGFTPGAADHYAEGVDAGTQEAGPALALLGNLLMMVGGARLRGEMPDLGEPPPLPRRPVGRKVVDVEALTSAQQKNLTRYTRRLPSSAEGTAITTGADGSLEFITKVPGRVPGSYAVYLKTVDSNGVTVGYAKATVTPDGSVLHVKDKMTR